MEINRVHLIDALQGLRSLPSSFADIIIADPPYNVGKDFGVLRERWTLEEYVEWSMKWINEAIRVLKPTGSLFIFGISETLAYLFVRIPLNKRWLIWHYTNKNNPCIHFWQRSHESIILAWKEGYIFNRDEIREPYTEEFLRNSAGKKRRSTKGRFSRGDKETIYTAHERGALPRDVIKVPALAGGAGAKERWGLCKTCDRVFAPKDKKLHDGHEVILHPTQKPEELIEKLILSAKPKGGGMVVVPFAGSGTECVVAKRLGLDFIGFEINPDYVRIAQERLRRVVASGNLYEQGIKRV
ncbi:MAG: site-specific DNA-methyltransferase [Aquificae bacterium]|nr:site-specific DNA-methyltransferase [Aquificota bacterium]